MENTTSMLTKWREMVRMETASQNRSLTQMATLVDDILHNQIVQPLMSLAAAKINAFVVYVTSKIGAA